MSKITDLYEEMEKANKAANYYLEELERTPTLRLHSMAKEAVDWHRQTIEIFEAALAARRAKQIILICIAFVLGILTYQYLKR